MGDMPELPSELQICKKCNQAIFEGHAYELGDDRWHISCFKCSKCDSSLGCNSNFLVLGNGNLICSQCSYNCKQCGKKIDDLAILTGDQAYCSNCFKCRSCKMKIEDLRYARTSKGLFCMECHEKLMAKKKKYDSRKRQLAGAAKDDGHRSSVASKSSRNSVLNQYIPAVASSSVGDELFSQPNKSSSSLSSSKNKSLPVPPSVKSPTPPQDYRRDSFQSAKTEMSANSLATSQFTMSTSGASPAVHSQLSGDFSIEEVGNFEDDEAFLQRAPSLRQRLNPQLAAALKSQQVSPGRSLLRSPQQLAREEEMPKLQPAVDLASIVPKPLAPERTQSSGSSSDNLSPSKFGKNLLILSPGQFHDHEFHSASQSQPSQPPESPPARATLQVDDSNKRPPTSPIARANRQARVVESNDYPSTDSINVHSVESDVSSTPRKLRSKNNTPVSPPPRFPLPHAPSDDAHSVQSQSQPQGLGLFGLEIDSDQSSVKPVEEEPVPLSRKTSMRTPKLPSLKHKRSVSGSGSSLATKFGFFSKGHHRQTSVGSTEGLALSSGATPQLASYQSPQFTSHTRSTSESYEVKTIDEITQMGMHKKQLEQEVRLLTNEKHSLLAEVRQLQEKVASETKEVAVLERKKKQLLDINQNLHMENDCVRNMASSSSNATVNSYYGEYEDSAAGGEPQRAARLKFWKRGKQQGGANLVSVNGSSYGQQLSVSDAKSSIPGSTSSHSLSINSMNGGSLAPSTDANKTTKFTKSRSSNILESFLGSEPSQIPLYSSTIQQRSEFEHARVPLIISKCLAEVERRGLDVEGIYRISGGNSAIVAIENAFANHATDDKMYKLDDTLDCDINAVTSALKRYLRKLPDPLIPFALYDEFIRVSSANAASKVDKRIEDLKAKVLDKLPPANLHTLYLLTKHLALVNQYSSMNRMGYKNLSVVFAPTICRDQSGEKEMIDMGYRNNVTELLMTNASTIFSNYPG